eukprot:13531553-Alexandrium_andersonii.AAC.1
MAPVQLGSLDDGVANGQPPEPPAADEAQPGRQDRKVRSEPPGGVDCRHGPGVNREPADHLSLTVGSEEQRLGVLLA